MSVEGFNEFFDLNALLFFPKCQFRSVHEARVHETPTKLCRKHFQERAAEPQVPPLRSPGFPVETRGVGDLYAALFTESRTRGRC
jgi:hypothetical protein